MNVFFQTFVSSHKKTYFLSPNANKFLSHSVKLDRRSGMLI